MKPLVLDDEADGEYRQAVGVYAAENLAVAVRFTELVEEALERIAAEPHIWPLVPGVREHLEVRKYRIDRFPYSVLFVELATEVRILAFAHGKRKPGYWLRRLTQ